MSNTTSDGGDGDDGSIWWTIFKIVAFVIGAIVILKWIFGLVWTLMPIVIAVGLLYLGYKLFLAGDSSDQQVESGQPALLEYDDSEVSMDDDLEVDPLEKKFQELERNS